MKKLIILCLSTLWLFSCGYNKSDSYKLADKAEPEVMPPPMQSGMAETTAQSIDEIRIDKKIIKDASIGIEVDNLEDFSNRLDSLIKYFKGYTSNDNLVKNPQYIRSDLTIRIPADNFEQFLNGLEDKNNKLLYKNISAHDVTEEFIDIEARLKTKKEIENRYVQLLSKARNVKEILEVEEKLGAIREEIESTEGRLNYLKSQVAYSTINLSVTQNFEYKYQPEKGKNFLQRLFKSLDKGWKGFIIFILFLFRIWPLILITFAVLYYIRYVKRKKGSSKEVKHQNNK